ncbi:MAG: allophanate hydrolase [Acidobacteriota bacterium]
MKPTEAVRRAYERMNTETKQPVWISRVPEEQAMARAFALEEHPEAAGGPLYGKVFAVKDNIDVAGLPTTAGCPAFAYTPEQSAPVVGLLEAAGAILVGKTNMDQFATGLVGTRSPYGACSSVLNAEYISGGSSSGSAVAVALGQVDFALGTDTAGSGRVPAAFNELIGLKPTRGLISATGVVPACRTLDCVSIFTRETGLAGDVLLAAAKPDPSDFLSRAAQGAKGTAWSAASFRLGVPAASQLEFFGDGEAAKLFEASVARFKQLGASVVEIDLSAFRAAAELLYSGPWVAERLAAIEAFAERHEADMNPVVAKIILGARQYSAVDGFRSQYRLAELQRACLREWEDMDCLLLPTTPTIFTHAEIAADPIGRNTQLGYYTNFVNLLDLSAIAIPAGRRPNGLPFGVTLTAPAMAEPALLATAERFLGGVGRSVVPSGFVEVAVVGAHLSGMPLNGQLTSRGAYLLEATRTAASYRLYALANTTPPKPGLEYVPGFDGPGIAVEVWAIPAAEFGSFVAAIPAPLGMGNAVLADGRGVKCFIAEPYALRDAEDITRFGGWRAFLQSRPA